MIDLSKPSISELKLNKTLSVPELRFYVSQLNKETHPSIVFYFLCQCRIERNTNGRWPDVNSSETNILNIYFMAQRRQIEEETLQDLKNILAKNQKTPLASSDALELFRVLKRIKTYRFNWKNFPISRTGFQVLIQMATDGYQHQAQPA